MVVIKGFLLAVAFLICWDAFWYAVLAVGNIFRKRKQTCFVYCPKCRNELVSSNSFVEDKDGIVKYKCDKCGNISFWDFIHYPVPYLRTCAGDCQHFYLDKCGNPDCAYGYICSPDTMVKFKKRTCTRKE